MRLVTGLSSFFFFSFAHVWPVRCGWGSGLLTYSLALEQGALAWASTCPTPQNPYDATTTDGENVFFLNPGSAPPYTGDVVTQLWAAEASTWNCPTNGCFDATTNCRDFRQLVWSSTSQLGCAAVASCPGAFPVVYVCRYRAAGNIVGQHPLANPQLQCPLNGGGSCGSSTFSSSTTVSSTGSSSSTSSSTTTTTGFTSSSTTSSTTTTNTPSPTTGPTVIPTYPPTCSPQPAKVTVVRPPQTKLRFAFDGMLDGVCEPSTPTLPQCPCTSFTPIGPVSVNGGAASSLVL